MIEETVSPIVEFHTEHDFEFPGEEGRMKPWVIAVAEAHGKTIQNAQFALVTDDELLALNQSHLQHDTYTDILTFPYDYEPIETDIYISYERVRDNATQLGINTDAELIRVMAHGILHMCGFDDHSDADVASIRAAEEQAIALWFKE